MLGPAVVAGIFAVILDGRGIYASADGLTHPALMAPAQGQGVPLVERGGRWASNTFKWNRPSLTTVKAAYYRLRAQLDCPEWY